MFDINILIYCNINNSKKLLKLDKYSLDLIKSGCKFNLKDTFSIKYQNQIKIIIEGHGSFIYKNNERYIGKWKDCKKDIYGIFYQNESIYEGEFKNDLKNGRGPY